MTVPGAFSILVVCTANICRSPLIEHLLRAELNAGPSEVAFDVRSAGILGLDGSGMDPHSAAELVRLGGDSAGFRARSFTAEIGSNADLILTAAVEHRAQVLQEFPRALRRTFTLLEFAHLVSEVSVVREAGSPRELVRLAAAARGAASIDAYDIPDPFGSSTHIHRQTASIVHNAVVSVAVGLRGGDDY